MPETINPSSLGVEQRIAGGELTVDLSALKANFRALAAASGGAKVAGVVKANAYGLGIEVVAPALLSAGCDTFFVALPHEGMALRRVAPDARIFVLTGLFGNEVAALYDEARLMPVLNTTRDVAVWESHCGASGKRLPCAIHVDTGMNRLGLPLAKALTLASENALTRALDISLVMTHLACADQPEHPLNARQHESFQQVRAAFGETESSLANSAGILLGSDYHQSLTRPGIALYGGMHSPALALQPVVTLKARVVQVRHAQAGEGVSYGSATLHRDSLLAVVSAGYADGYPRALSGAGIPLRDAAPAGGAGFLHGRRVPIVGRVTMDLTIFDVTDLGPDAVQEGDMIELIGPNMPLAELAAASGTIPYEILTSLGARTHRRIVG